MQPGAPFGGMGPSLPSDHYPGGQDHFAGDAAQVRPPSQTPPQLPRPGMALIEELDHLVMVQLWDGSKLFGTLRSVDIYGNFVLEKTYERKICGSLYHDKYHGLQVVRGENVVIMGRVDPENEYPPQLTRVSAGRIEKALQAEKEADLLRGNILKQFDFLD